MRRTSEIAAIAAVLLLAATPVPADAPATDSPYVDAQRRDIKALAPEEIEDLAAGHGMGLSMAAELNHYPGPRHVLDSAGGLALTAAQREQAAALYAEVQRDATAIGRAIIADEQALDALFASGAAELGPVDALVARIAERRGALRFVHLAAHVKMRDLLTPQQIARYDE
ncbi:MAG: Spy/CpxP family protein refolding chaperone, partial [Gammaproteobacteria bacterium]